VRTSRWSIVCESTSQPSWIIDLIICGLISPPVMLFSFRLSTPGQPSFFSTGAALSYWLA